MKINQSYRKISLAILFTFAILLIIKKGIFDSRSIDLGQKEFLESPLNEYGNVSSNDFKGRLTAFNEHIGEKFKAHNSVVALPNWPTNVATLKQQHFRSIKQANDLLDKVSKLTDDEITFNSSLAKIEEANRIVNNNYGIVQLLAAVSKSKALRDESNNIRSKLDAWEIETSSREDLYQIVSKLEKTSAKFSDDEKRLIEHYMRNYKRIGFHLPKKSFARVKQLKKDISNYKIKFENNVKEANKKISIFKPEDLKGLKETDIDLFPKNKDGNYELTSGNIAQVFAILKNASSESARKRVSTLRLSRAKDTNPPLIKKILSTRAEISSLLGYAHWADYATEVKMVKNAKTALDFLNQLKNDLEPKFKKEKKVLLALKIAETKNKKASLSSWDTGYYTNQLKKTKYKVDTDALKKYFELKNTLKGMFRIYEHLFDINIEYIEAPYVWDEKVKLLLLSEKSTGAPLGLLYLDLYPRIKDSKYGHFAMFPIQSVYTDDNNMSVRPVAALVCNFPEATEKTPSLLTLDHVETLFHEFGHGLHTMLSQSRFASFAGTSVPWDFVEAPSQLLEKWLRDPQVLESFAVSYKDPNDRFPLSLIPKIEEAEIATKGIGYRAQVSFGLADLTFYTKTEINEDFDPISESNKIFNEVYIPGPENTSRITSFAHIFSGGYAAGYYGYAWSDSLAADMTSEFANSDYGFLDKNVGMRLRREIYERGNTRDVADSVEAFLGRKSSNKAFMRSLGL